MARTGAPTPFLDTVVSAIDAVLGRPAGDPIAADAGQPTEARLPAQTDDRIHPPLDAGSVEIVHVEPAADVADAMTNENWMPPGAPTSAPNTPPAVVQTAGYRATLPIAPAAALRLVPGSGIPRRIVIAVALDADAGKRISLSTDGRQDDTGFQITPAMGPIVLTTQAPIYAIVSGGATAAILSVWIEPAASS